MTDVCFVAWSVIRRTGAQQCKQTSEPTFVCTKPRQIALLVTVIGDGEAPPSTYLIEHSFTQSVLQ